MIGKGFAFGWIGKEIGNFIHIVCDTKLHQGYYKDFELFSELEVPATVQYIKFLYLIVNFLGIFDKVR